MSHRPVVRINVEALGSTSPNRPRFVGRGLVEKEQIVQFESELAKLAESLDPQAVERRIEELEKEMSAPGFWEHRRRSQEAARQLERSRTLLRRFQDLETVLEDVTVLFEMASEAGDESELAGLEPRLADAWRKLSKFRIETLYSGAYDLSDCYFSINAGAGGTDSQDWAEMLLRMYSRWGERKGVIVTLLDVSEGDTAGIRSATLEISGAYAYGNLRHENGVHRLVRISPFDSANRRHTSFAAVSVIPVTETEEVEIDSKDLRIDTYRASGAGGQHVNVTDSAVRITHLPTGIVVSCQNERSQHQNKEVAMRVLVSRLAELMRQQQAEKLEQIQGKQMEIEWGSQIRSYVLHPYQLVKDHRTGEETSGVDAVLDGDIDRFLEAAIEAEAASKTGPHDRRLESSAS